jgi:oxygen-dependent protoporphyrinogen oxidase
MTFAIIGGGISGLSLAFQLSRRGQDVLLFEASPRLGGTIRSENRDGFIIEAGPNGFLDNEPATHALAASLGIAGKIRPAEVTASRRFIFTRGALRPVPSSPPAFLKSDILPFHARIRVLGELLTRRGPELENETLGSFSRRHFGRAAAEVLVDAFQSGIFAGDPEKLSVEAAFPRLAALEREHRSLMLGMGRIARQRRAEGAPSQPGVGTLNTFEGGLSTLISSLADHLGSSIRTDATVQSISRVGTRWRLSVLDRGHVALWEATQVVLAVPAYAAASLLRPLNGKLSSELESIEYAPVAVVQLGFRGSAVDNNVPPGFGFLAPAREGLNILGAIFASKIFPWRAPPKALLLTCMMGGVRRGELFKKLDDELLALAGSDLKRVLHFAAEPDFVEIVRWPRGIPQYNVGHLARLRRIAEALASLPGISLTGNAYHGVGLNDCIRNATALAKRLAVHHTVPTAAVGK